MRGLKKPRLQRLPPSGFVWQNKFFWQISPPVAEIKSGTGEKKNPQPGGSGLYPNWSFTVSYFWFPDASGYTRKESCLLHCFLNAFLGLGGGLGADLAGLGGTDGFELDDAADDRPDDKDSQTHDESEGPVLFVQNDEQTDTHDQS